MRVTWRAHDRCYSFWAGGALALLGHADLVDVAANRAFLLRTEGKVSGGFSKIPNVTAGALSNCSYECIRYIWRNGYIDGDIDI